MKKYELKKRLQQLEEQEVQIKKEWRETYQQLQKIEKEEHCWVTHKFKSVTK